MSAESFTITAPDGQQVACFRWRADAPKAAVQIEHGAAEHAARYGRVAERLVGAGYEVFANDHRAHGRTADQFGTFGVARPGGWSAIVDDAHQLTRHIRDELPDAPIVLFGHSMGSFIAQQYVQQWGDGLAGLVLSGTAGGLDLDDATMAIITALGEGDGADEPSEVFAAMFGGFNEPFAGPDATGFEWLSRDADEVAAYVADPWCGFPLSNGYVADMLAGTAATWTPEAEANIPRDLPVYVMGGAQDPVGGENVQSVKDLVARYEAAGIGPITLKLYDGGRHEMLNETNRDEVETDLVAWLDATV
ncbi:MAG: alpha/beta hydrolase [Ilumatobacter sp.]|nr:alpha/beta hydrolase [Ilumatobacter sp.]